jgi:ABC-type uncharacterized transport system ATPase subunit
LVSQATVTVITIVVACSAAKRLATLIVLDTTDAGTPDACRATCRRTRQQLLPRCPGLGAELIARPCLLYIDEATSGLDAGTEARMMRLFRKLADKGKSVVCITHNVDNVERCHLAIFVARGRLMYYGPPSEAPSHFGVGRISEIYDRLADPELAPPLAWLGELLLSGHGYGRLKRREQSRVP